MRRIAELFGVFDHKAHAFGIVTDEIRRGIVIANRTDFLEVRIRLGDDADPRVDVRKVRRIAAGPRAAAIDQQ